MYASRFSQFKKLLFNSFPHLFSQYYSLKCGILWNNRRFYFCLSDYLNVVRHIKESEILVLCKNCPYSEVISSVSFRIRNESGDLLSNNQYSVWIQENPNQNNSQYGLLVLNGLIFEDYLFNISSYPLKWNRLLTFSTS